MDILFKADKLHYFNQDILLSYPILRKHMYNPH
jgi:hypothetical protein